MADGNTEAVAEPKQGPTAENNELPSRPAKRSREEPPPAPQQPRRRPTERLEPSYFGVRPHDEFTREVADRIWLCSNNRQHVEIEAKIGLLMDSTTKGKQRLQWPVATESILTDVSMCYFTSDMSAQQHAAFNQLLNERVQQAMSPSYNGARVTFQHTREIDVSYSARPGEGSNATRTRVTMLQHPEQPGRRIIKPNGIISKTRLGDINVLSPKQPFDFRISINTETPRSLPDTPVASERYKDRVSYSHQILRIDLTKVTGYGGPDSHEIEVEFRNVPELLAEAAKEYATPPIPNMYLEMIAVFLNTVRMIIKNSGAS